MTFYKCILEIFKILKRMFAFKVQKFRILKVNIRAFAKTYFFQTSFQYFEDGNSIFSNINSVQSIKFSKL